VTGRSSRPIRIAVAGTSAGANLAVGATLAHARTPAAPAAQLLAYPVLHGDPKSPSRTAFAEGYGFTSQAIEWFIGQYLTHPDQRRDPRFAPVLSPHLATLPPTVLGGAGLDPLRDDTRLFLKRLRAEGVTVVSFEEPTLPHGFWKYAPLADTAADAATRMCEAFRDLLDSTADRPAP
jgi:acetyl esterase